MVAISPRPRPQVGPYHNEWFPHEPESTDSRDKFAQRLFQLTRRWNCYIAVGMRVKFPKTNLFFPKRVFQQL